MLNKNVKKSFKNFGDFSFGVKPRVESNKLSYFFLRHNWHTNGY